MTVWNPTLHYGGSSRSGGYRKAVRETAHRSPVWAKGDTLPAARTAAEELADSLRELKATNPDVWTGINEAYQALVDKKFTSGLSAGETERMDRLGAALDRLVEPYDLARIAFIESRAPRG